MVGPQLELIPCSGAYCSMSIIALLDLPLELAHDAPARRSGLTSFVDGLPQWLSRCRSRPGAAGSRSKLTLA